MNREKVKKTAEFLSVPFSVKSMQKLTGERFVFPFYHLVSEKTSSYIRNLYQGVTPEQFIADLEFLLKHFEPASSDDLKTYISRGKKSHKPYFFLSFDDGLKECFEIVYPVLKKKGIPAAFFINPGFVDNKAIFYRFRISLIIEKIKHLRNESVLLHLNTLLNFQDVSETELIKKVFSLRFDQNELIERIGKILEVDFAEVLKNEKPYMSLEQIKKLDKEGFLIGSHSWDHPLFSDLTEEGQISQFEKSMQFVSENFKPELQTFAFPFTDDGVSASFFDHLEKSEKVDISFGTAGLKRDSCPKHIQRIPMEVMRKDGKQIIREEYAYFFIKAFFNRNQINR